MSCPLCSEDFRAGYRNGESAIDPEDPGQIRALLDQAHAMLIKGLVKETDEL